MKYTFSKSCADYTLRSQRKMIQKAIPEFDDTKQYVLWLVPDLYTGYSVSDIQATLEIYDVNGAALNIPYDRLMVRTPYYNKRIFQLGVARGRYRIFGVPLVFDCLEDMEKIHMIKVKWQLLRPVYLHTTQGPIWLLVDQLTTEYRVQFNLEGVEENHYFTIDHQDQLLDECDDKERKELENWYDIAIMAKGTGELNGEKASFTSDWTLFTADRRSAISADEIVYFENMIRDFKPDADYIRKVGDKEGIQCMEEWIINLNYYKKSIVLTADPFAYILTEPGFGFDMC